MIKNALNLAPSSIAALVSMGTVAGFIGWAMPAAAVPEPLSDVEVQNQLRSLPGWQTDAEILSCTYRLPDFVAAIDFVNALVEPAETMRHHPDLTIRYNQVTVDLTTHDAGGLTTLDFQLAQQIEAIATAADSSCQSQ